MKHLVSAAFEPELTRFRELAPALGCDVVVEPAGIGVVDAAVGLTLGIARAQPDHVLFLGTCGGAPGSGLVVGDVLLGSAVALVDVTVLEEKAKMPFDAALEPTSDPVLRAALLEAGAREARIVTTLAVTLDDAIAARLAPHGDVEQLEAYGVARACAAAGVPCAILLGVTNTVGRAGSEEWRENHASVSARVADVAFAALRTSTRARSPGRS